MIFGFAHFRRGAALRTELALPRSAQERASIDCTNRIRTVQQMAHRRHNAALRGARVDRFAALLREARHCSEMLNSHTHQIARRIEFDTYVCVERASPFPLGVREFEPRRIGTIEM